MASFKTLSCERAMPSHGRVLIIERLIPPPGDPNRQAMAFRDLFFLVLEGGAIRTSDELSQILVAADLGTSRVISTTSTFSIVEAHRV